MPRGVAAVAHRCPCGAPDVVRTEPRLPDGTPFPTTYYATCPRLTGAISTLETAGVMREMTERLGRDPELARGLPRGPRATTCAAAPSSARCPRSTGVSAGGMPTRVKCLHVLVGHSLAAGPGVNPLGDEALAALRRSGGGLEVAACRAGGRRARVHRRAPVSDRGRP